MTTAEIVKASKVSNFISYRNNNLIYETDNGFSFSIPTEDVKGATILAQDKTMFFMRWIRKQVEQNSIENK